MSSPIYPDRPIRPLPKRRLRSRLSDDVVESMDYPRPISVSTPLFYFPRSYNDGRNGMSDPETRDQAEHDAACDHGPRDHNEAEDFDSDEEIAAVRSNRAFQAEQDYVALNKLHVSQSLELHAQQQTQHHRSVQPSLVNKPPTPQSAASSIDGYDSFENTNNKKKRKIPTPGSTNGHHSHLSTEMANMGLGSSREADGNPPDEPGTGAGQYYGSGNSASPVGASSNALSGSGRGRFGRARGIRSPLGVASDASNVWPNGRSRRLNSRDGLPSGAFAKDYATHRSPRPIRMGSLAATAQSEITQASDLGIISAAIASAAEGSMRPPPKGQEHVSLLQQRANRKVTPTKTQFTFTSAANVIWPGGSPTIMGQSTSNSIAESPLASYPGQEAHLKGSSVATHATQTSPLALNNGIRRGPQPQYTSSTVTHDGLESHRAGAEGEPQTLPTTRRSRPRRTGREYQVAATNRRIQQQQKNYERPPARDDIWICEFCEYESIFGSPPEALSRQYEIKAARQKRRDAEKKRLLEKAKQKGRKGKRTKGGKTAAPVGSNAIINQEQQQEQHPTQAVDPNQQYNGNPTDDYLDDDEDDYDEEDVTLNTAIPQQAIRALNIAPNVGLQQNGDDRGHDGFGTGTRGL